MSESSETVELERRGSVALLRLNRPDKLNSFTAQMHEQLRVAFDAMEATVGAEDGVRALVLTGAGRAFCSGQDLGERRFEAGVAPDLGASLRRNYNPLILRLARLPLPVIAAVNGVAAGAGASLALACDIVLAARSARFLLPFSRLGLVPDAGATWTLPRLIGLGRARALAMLAESISAEQALQWGLAWQVLDDERLLPSALDLAGRLAQQATRGFALQKRAWADSGANTLAQQLELEAQLQGEAGRSADFAEGVAAFLQRREARMRGR